MQTSSLGSRIKAIRATQNITQQDFAERIGISRGGLANYEVDRNVPIDAVIVSICREFGVNESWLRTGEGEMLRPVDRDEEIAAFMGDVMCGETPDFRRRLIAVLAKLDSSEWELLEKMAQKLAAECKETDQA